MSAARFDRDGSGFRLDVTSRSWQGGGSMVQPGCPPRFVDRASRLPSSMDAGSSVREPCFPWQGGCSPRAVHAPLLAAKARPRLRASEGVADRSVTPAATRTSSLHTVRSSVLGPKDRSQERPRLYAARTGVSAIGSGVAAIGNEAGDGHAETDSEGHHVVLKKCRAICRYSRMILQPRPRRFKANQ